MSAPQMTIEECQALLRACTHRLAFLGVIQRPSLEPAVIFPARREVELLKSAAKQLHVSMWSEA